MAEAKIAFLRKFLAEHPTYKYVTFIVVRGRALTPQDALEKLERGEDVDEIVGAMRMAGYDPRQPVEQLALEYYSRLARLRPKFKVVFIWKEDEKEVREEVTAERAASEIRLKTPLGVKFVESYARLLADMRKRMK